jgi:hypothetical protein
VVAISFGLLAWFAALKLAGGESPIKPAVLGCIAGVVFSVGAWIDVQVSHDSAWQAAVATLLYIIAGAFFVRWFSRTESIILGLLIVAAGTVVLVFGVRLVAEAVTRHDPTGTGNVSV